jgi:hypothetical protein
LRILSNVIKEVIQIARRDYSCDDCKKPILKRSKYHYLFGSAFKGEKPYSIRICQNCKPIDA